MKIKALLKFSKDVSFKINNDHVSAFAAQAAFYILLSFFPFVIFILTLTHYLPFTQEDFTTFIIAFLPKDLIEYVKIIISDLYTKSNGTIISFSIIACLWSASRGILAITNGLNSVYESKESRNYFVIRGVSTIYTLILAIILILTLILFVFGNKIYDTIIIHAPFYNNIAGLIINLRSVVGLIVLFIFFLLIYKFIPNYKTTLRKETPGAILASVGWVLSSFLFSIFIDYFGNYSYMYGSLAGIVIAMLWLYFSMYIVFIGGELNYILRQIYSDL